MSRFTGPQGRGALQAHRKRLRGEALDRQAAAFTRAQDDIGGDDETGATPAGSWTMCDCGKRGYGSKRAALDANSTNGRRLRAYQCGGLWHVSKNAFDLLKKETPAARKERETDVA